MRIVLVDDHAVVRAGYSALIACQPDMSVVAEFADAASAYRDPRTSDADIVIMDLSMPGASALETIARLLRRCPNLAALVFTMHARASFARQALAAGARGYVTKSSEPDTLLQALREIGSGGRYLSADVAQLLAWERFEHDRSALDDLSVREFEVLRALLAGNSADEIATTLNLSQKTVRNLHYSVKRKLGVRDDIELVRIALRLDVVDLPSLLNS